MPAAVRRFGRQSADYLAALDDYIRHRLPEPMRADAALRAAIVGAADERFAYVAFLTERAARGKVDRDGLIEAAAGHGDAGQALYKRWLAQLEYEHGPKLAGPMREVLAALWAAERAHAWIFGDGAIADPAGGTLTPLPAAFDGLAIASLQSLLLQDRPGRAFSPELLLTLQQMEGVLAIHRGDGHSRFRIGLKDLGPAIGQDEDLAPMIPRAHQRLVITALDALEGVAQARERHPDSPVDQLPGWPLFDELAPYLDAAVALGGSEPLAARWRRSRETAEALQDAYDDLLEHRARGDLRPRPLTLLLGWAAQRRGEPQGDNHFAGRLQNRGIAHRDNGDLAAAIADLDAAVRIREDLRDTLIAGGGQAAWSPPLRNDLAMVLQNRGNAHWTNGDLAAAIADYDAAVRIDEDLRDALIASGGQAAWSGPLRNDLARVLANRGNAHQNNGDLAAAIADYDAAVRIREDLRDALIASGGQAAWSGPLRNDLAMVLANRGNAHQDSGDLAAAIADLDAAVHIREDLRDALIASGGQAAWSGPLRNDLAGVLQNRGIAHADNGDLAAAIADYDAAVRIREDLRDALIAGGGQAAWSGPLRNDLAAVLQNRGIAHKDNGDLAAAIADFDAAVRIGEDLRDALIASGGQAAWSGPLRNDLARVLQNRGNAHKDKGDLAAAIADFDAAVRIREDLRDALIASGGQAAWSGPLRNDLAGTLQNRGLAHANNGDLAAAIADYDAAVRIREDLRDGLITSGGQAAWSPPLRLDLARTYCARAAITGPGTGAADLEAAADIADGLRAIGHGDLASQVQGFIDYVRSRWTTQNAED